MSALFPNDNDWVVDSYSMAHKLALPNKQVLDYGLTNKVHYTKYFMDQATVKKLGEWLGV